MVAPLVAGAIAGGSGLAGALFGGDKEQEQNRYDTQISKKISRTSSEQTTVSPQISDQLSYNPQIQIGSTGGISSKKQQQQEPTQETSPSQPVVIRQESSKETGDQGQSQGTDMTKMLAIGGALAGATYIVNKKVN